MRNACITMKEGEKEGVLFTSLPASHASKSAVELQSHKQVNFPPYSSPPRRRNSAEILLSSLEVSRASVTSADVQMIESKQTANVQRPLQVSLLSIKPICIRGYIS